MRFICTGDLHIGRYPTRIPEDAACTVASVWQHTVDAAIEHDVEAVLLTGDIADQDNKFFEAYAPLRQGVERLAEAGIHTYAVSGNHDYDVLPRLADTLPGHFTLLGRDGTWETVVIEHDGQPMLRLLGWSFPGQYAHISPLKTLTLESADVPTLALLHADLDQPASPYAPVTRVELNDVEVAAWLLGHIHKPDEYEHRDGFILYPGSLQPLDPGEAGVHGPWLLEVQVDGSVVARQLPLATIQYETLEVDVSDAENRETLEQRVVQAIEESLAALTAGRDKLRYVVYRLTLTGRSSIHRQLPDYVEQIREELDVPIGSASGTIDKILLATRPKASLLDHVERRDPIGVLARLLRELESGDGELGEEATALMQQANEHAHGISSSSAYAPLRQAQQLSTSAEASQLRQVLHAQGLLLLDELLAQQSPEA